MNYAAAARSGRKQPHPGRPPATATTPQASSKKCDHLKVSADNMKRINESERRTQVLRRVPPTTTPSFILAELDRQLEVPLTDVVEAVVQDCLDRRRFYVRYVSVEKKREASRRGFELGNIRIPGEPADITGFVRDVPHYLTEADMNGILGRYGTVVSSGFITYGETDIRCGGFRFELDLHENAKLPNSIRILNDIMHIHQKDDVKTCGWCDRVGHITRHCRQRIEALEKRAMAEFQEQQEEPQQMEEGEPGHRDTQEDQPPNSEPRIPASNTSTTTTPLPELQPTPSITTYTPTTDLVPTQVLHSLTTTTSPTSTEDSQRSELPTPTPSATQTPTQQNTVTQFISGGQLQMEPKGHATPTEQPLGITLNPEDSDDDPEDSDEDDPVDPVEPTIYDEILKNFGKTFTSYYDTFHMQYNQGKVLMHEAQQLIIKEATNITAKEMLTKYDDITWQIFLQERRNRNEDKSVFDPYLYEQ